MLRLLADIAAFLLLRLLADIAAFLFPVSLSARRLVGQRVALARKAPSTLWA